MTEDLKKIDQSMGVWCKDLRKSYCNVRLPKFHHKRYSLILFGKCNFRCKFCFEDGNLATESGILPEANKIPYHNILDFVKEECKKSNWIKITGGEPSLFPKITLDLIDEIHSYGSKVCIDTNGSLPETVKEFSEKADIIGIDIKGNLNNIHYLTGRSSDQSYFPVLDTIKNSNLFKCIVEVKTILFDITSLADLIEIYSFIPKNVYWEWKQYRPHSGKLRIPKKYYFQPMQNEQIFRFAHQLVNRFPELRKRLIIICGSGRIPSNYYMFSEDLKDYALSHENYIEHSKSDLIKGEIDE